MDQPERADDGGARLRAGLTAATYTATGLSTQAERLHAEAAILTAVLARGQCG